MRLNNRRFCLGQLRVCLCLICAPLLVFASVGCAQQPAKSGFKLPAIRSVKDSDEKTSSFLRKDQNNVINLNSERYGDASLNYQITGGVSNQFFVVDIRVAIDNLSFQNSKQLSVSIKADQNYDQNGAQASSVLLDAGSGQSLRLQRIVKLDSRGRSAFSLVVGSDDNLAKGSLTVINPTGKYLVDDSDYVIRFSKDKTVEFVFSKKDIHGTTNDKCVNYLLEKLSKLRKSLVSLCDGYDPYGGVTQFIFTENIPYTALAGDPIYVDHAELAELLLQTKTAMASRTIHQDDTLCVLCHEMSHTFDFSGSGNQVAGYVFDREFFAILKEVYAFQDNGYTISSDFFGAVPPLSSGIYSYDGFLQGLLTKLCLRQPADWIHMKKALTALRSSDPKATDAEKFAAFVKKLSKESGVSVSARFTQVEWKTILGHFSH